MSEPAVDARAAPSIPDGASVTPAKPPKFRAVGDKLEVLVRLYKEARGNLGNLSQAQRKDVVKFVGMNKDSQLKSFFATHTKRLKRQQAQNLGDLALPSSAELVVNLKAAVADRFATSVPPALARLFLDPRCCHPCPCGWALSNRRPTAAPLRALFCERSVRVFVERCQGVQGADAGYEAAFPGATARAFPCQSECIPAPPWCSALPPPRDPSAEHSMLRTVPAMNYFIRGYFALRMYTK